MSHCWMLQVEDDENDIRLLRFAMEAVRLSDALRSVNSGQQAIDYFEGREPYSDRLLYPLPHLVLLDLRMPRMNGFEVLRWIRARPRFRRMVVILFTASAHPDDITQACDLGANAFVQKPSSLAELVRFLEQLKGFWFEFHQFPPDAAPRINEDVERTELSP